MKTKILVYVFAIIGATVMFFNGCKKEDDKNAPALSTAGVTEITHIAAVSEGSITDDGGATITARGVCWGTNQNPTINDSKT